VSIEDAQSLSSAKNDIVDQDQMIDVHKYLDSMPNERYRDVLLSLFLEDREPEDLARDMGTPVSNIYNIKSRALDQLRDIVLYSNEINNLEKYINLISDDRKRKILVSIFIDKRGYNEVCSEFKITEIEFKKIKKDAIKEIKNIIFKIRS
jgi:DNA-directed RNA polymerase specialized sigma subunit